jgi:hypothetical protein
MNIVCEVREEEVVARFLIVGNNSSAPSLDNSERVQLNKAIQLFQSCFYVFI